MSSVSWVKLRILFSCEDFKDYIGSGHVKIAPEVYDALARGKAVVALESTIISHGKLIL